MLLHRKRIPFEVAPGEHLDFWTHYDTGYWEPDTLDCLARYLDREHTYIDIGAWIGPTVLYACHRAKHVYAAEPDPIAVPYLIENLRLNWFSNVSLYEGAIGDGSSDTMWLGAPPNKYLGQSVTTYTGKLQSFLARCMTLKDFFLHYSIRDCSLIKIDIEGAEAIVLPEAFPFLEYMGIPLHLSIHPELMSAADLERIAALLSPYRLGDFTVNDIRAGSVKEVLVRF